MTDLEVSVVVPAYQEDGIVDAVRRIVDAVPIRHELLVVVDAPDDRTIAAFSRVATDFPTCRVLVQDYGRGPANALRYGIEMASAPVIVVTMADGSDEVAIIPQMVELVRAGNAIAAASRYARGGRQIGGPLLKRALSRTAGHLLGMVGRVGTHDATNSFKAYDAGFLGDVGVDARAGFELGIEMVAKARRLRLRVAEIPTVWRDRELGVSNFKLMQWIPEYLRWFVFAFGPRLTAEQVRELQKSR